MPNGGPTPDCFHCKLFEGSYAEDDPKYCALHKINLASPIRAFCPGYVDPEPNEYGDWLDQKLDRYSLKPDWMYVWLDWSDEEDWEAEGITQTFEHFPLAPISEYENWTSEEFLDAIAKIADEKRGQ